MSWIVVRKKTLPEAWEKAVIDCWDMGAQIPTQYDKPGDPLSRDCTAFIVVEEPLAEPRIHRAFPAGLEDLWVYREEVVSGVHDHWIDPDAGKWSYTYHQRFRAYPTSEGTFDQVEQAIALLAEAPHTRRAQAITWIPDGDSFDEHCPCVQRLWFRVFDDLLHMHLHIRSNDAFKAGFMNMFAMVDLQATIAAELSRRLGRVIGVGPYTHIADSWHIYGSYAAEVEGFIEHAQHRTFEERVWRSDDEIVQACFEEGRARLAKEDTA